MADASNELVGTAGTGKALLACLSEAIAGTISGPVALNCGNAVGTEAVSPG